MQNIDEHEVLRDVLSGLNEEVPPMPEGLHASWMQKVEDDMAEKRTEKARSRKAFTRFLGVAAAMVFIIGGTLVTRDDMDAALRRDAAYQQLHAQNEELNFAAATAEEYAQDLRAYDGAVAEAAEESNALVFSARSAKTAGAAPQSPAYEGGMGGGANGAASVPEATQKKIIRTASLTIQTQRYEDSLASLRAMCEAEGGWIESSSESVSSSNGLRRAYLTLRIPQDALDSYLTGTQELGRITSRSETAQDVTASYQDTQARLDTQLALMERLQALITESGDLSDLLALESQIADTQYMIDALQSSLAGTDRQVAYSTVSVSLFEEKAPALTDTTVSLGERIVAAVRIGWNAIADFTGDMLVFLVAALPCIVVVVVAVAAVAVVRRIRRRNAK